MYLSENGIQVVATRDDGRFMRKVTIEIDDFVFTRCDPENVVQYISDVLMGKFPTLNDDLKTAQEEVQRLCLLLSVEEAKSRAKDKTIQHLKDPDQREAHEGGLMVNNPITPALELLTKRMEAGELKPRQFDLVARELMRTAIFAYRTRPTPEEDARAIAEHNL